MKPFIFIAYKDFDRDEVVQAAEVSAATTDDAILGTVDGVDRLQLRDFVCELRDRDTGSLVWMHPAH